MPTKTDAPATARQDGHTRRELLKVTASAAAGAAVVAASTAAIVAPSPARAATCSGLDALEAFPVSPLVLQPFTDPLPVPSAIRPVTPAQLATWTSQPGPGIGQQDCDGGTHQLYPGQAGTVAAGMPAPAIYDLRMQVSAHAYTASRCARRWPTATSPAG